MRSAKCFDAVSSGFSLQLSGGSTGSEVEGTFANHQMQYNNAAGTVARVARGRGGECLRERGGGGADKWQQNMANKMDEGCAN